MWSKTLCSLTEPCRRHPLRGGMPYNELVTAAKLRAFDCLLVDDTSRIARDLSDALRTFKILEFHGVAVVSVSQGIDSLQGNARPLLAMHGIMDEQHLTDLAKKVHRGQEGRALHGFTTGRRVYRYDNVPIEDPNRTGKYGRPAVLGVKLKVNPEQAAVVNRIFRMSADGNGLRTIAVELTAEGVPGPNGPWSRFTRCCETSATTASPCGAALRRRGTPKRGRRSAAPLRNPSGGESKFPIGASCRKSYGKQYRVALGRGISAGKAG